MPKPRPQGAGLLSYPGWWFMRPDPGGLNRNEAAERLGNDVTPHMVSMWALRGWIDPTTGKRRYLRMLGVGPEGMRRYHWPDLVSAEAATRRHPNSRRRPVEATA